MTAPDGPPAPRSALPGPLGSVRRLGVVGAVGSLLGLILLGTEASAVSRDLETPRDLHRVAFAGSGTCARCHPSHAASFARTFHRTMTREASRETVLAPFAGETLRYGGFVARMTTETDAAGAVAFVVTLSRVEAGSAEEVVDRAVVSRTVGSHRDQQLLAREDDRWVRLPVAWDIEESRWIHMNEAFLTPDPEGLDEDHIALRDYARHVVPWNDNCVFCHNVGARPGLDPATGRFSTEVAELGIACEACHGPGEEHARLNASPIRRYALHGGGLSDRADPTIVSPARLSPERAADICGRCHGQRITDDVARFLREGDPFVPGEDLALYSAPLFADTTLHGREEFAARFWDDGTARLTAYEYQGYTQSRCASEGALTCTDCHAMHDGDPRGQLRPDLDLDGLCTRCHGALDAPGARARHVMPASRGGSLEGPPHTGVACVDCHMPRVVYGLRAAHRSHRIDSPPRVPSMRTSDRLDACALCHLDGSAGHASAPVDDLFAGDPIQRAVVAAALGRLDTHASLGPSHEERAALLLEVMRDDRYPGVRSIAWASLRALEDAPLGIGAFSPTGPAHTRADEVRDLARRLGTEPAPRERHQALRARAGERAIEIGE